MDSKTNERITHTTIILPAKPDFLGNLRKEIKRKQRRKKSSLYQRFLHVSLSSAISLLFTYAKIKKTRAKSEGFAYFSQNAGSL